MDSGQPGNSWEHLAHHKGYNGIGFYVAHFDDARFGNPISLFAFHGGNLIEFSQRAHLQYEWNFGYSTEWRHYDAFSLAPTTSPSAHARISISVPICFWSGSLPVILDLKVGAGADALLQRCPQSAQQGNEPLLADGGAGLPLGRPVVHLRQSEHPAGERLVWTEPPPPNLAPIIHAVSSIS
jgi:hypothetical protein